MASRCGYCGDAPSPRRSTAVAIIDIEIDVAHADGPVTQSDTALHNRDGIRGAQAAGNARVAHGIIIQHCIGTSDQDGLFQRI